MTPRGFLCSLRRDTRGAMAIETAIVAPVLALMAIGSFEVGTMVSRQQELQSAASEAESIILAASASEVETSSADIEDVIETSLDLAPGQVQLDQMFRCDSGTMSATAPTCASGQLYIYVEVALTDTYTPVWSNYGFGDTIDYSVVRTVMVQ
jgi:Flp pilus assembly protein TadG